MVQSENLLTYDQKLLISKIGQLTPSMMQQVSDCLRAALDLASQCSTIGDEVGQRRRLFSDGPGR